jgi:CRP-like cAMP-binding protein
MDKGVIMNYNSLPALPYDARHLSDARGAVNYQGDYHIGTRHRIAFWQSSVTHSPRKNRILAALPEADYERLLPYLEFVQLPSGSTLNEAGSHLSFAYFPIAGIVSPLYVMKNGAVSAVSITGNEGVVGTSLFMGGGSSLNWSVVQSAGYAYRLSANKLKQEFERGGYLCQLLLRFTQSLITQIAQTAACNRYHTLKQQLCRWLLLSLDRIPTNELKLTHEFLANILGVRREGVTNTAGDLQKAGVIRYSRGRITVLDRPMLEKCACECYAVVKKNERSLLSYEIRGFNHN